MYLMENLIPVISKVQDAFAKVNGSSEIIHLPQIVVIGSQSSGKSSLLERIVGKDFLPRGTGIVTRQPLILDLINTPKNDKRRKALGAPNDADFAVFEEESATVYTNFTDVRNYIQLITDRVCGTKNGIANIPIKLKVYSHRVSDLSLVDLPGITNMAVGDQPENIGVMLRSMVNHYISNENTIIIAVTPANQDIATSEALKMAKDVDPEGNRTLAVITKLDLMDQGTNAMDVLKGKIIPVKLGIVGVRNRGYSQMDQPLEEAMKEETRFLNKHYAEIAGKHGVEHLTKMLSDLLMRHIQTVLPSLTSKISEKTIKFEQKLADLGEAFTDPEAANDGLIKIVHEFCTFYREYTYDGVVDLTATDVCPAVMMSSILHEQLTKAVDKIQPMKAIIDDQISLMIRNSQGLHTRLFIPPQAFKIILKIHIEKLKDAALICVDNIRNEMSAAVGRFNSHEYFTRFPRLRAKFIQLVEDKLDELSYKTKNYVSHSILSESTYINTQHTGFKTQYKKNVDNIMRMRAESDNEEMPLSDEEKEDTTVGSSDTVNVNRRRSLLDRRNINMIYFTIADYFTVVSNNVKDHVPTLVVCGMIDEMHEELEKLLLKKLYKSDDVVSLFRESEDSVCRRQNVVNTLEALRTASNEIRSIGYRPSLTPKSEI